MLNQVVFYIIPKRLLVIVTADCSSAIIEAAEIQRVVERKVWKYWGVRGLELFYTSRWIKKESKTNL